jgi:hypothetical protein
MIIERRWQTRTVDTEEGSALLSAYVFHCGDGRPIGDFRKAWATACATAGMPGLPFHDLRRSAVRNLDPNGVSQVIGMMISGHKTASVYRIEFREQVRDMGICEVLFAPRSPWQRAMRWAALEPFSFSLASCSWALNFCRMSPCEISSDPTLISKRLGTPQSSIGRAYRAGHSKHRAVPFEHHECGVLIGEPAERCQRNETIRADYYETAKAMTNPGKTGFVALASHPIPSLRTRWPRSRHTVIP